MKFNLDFSIYYAKDRMEAIRSIDLTKLTNSELETITNYVLYGKDEDGTSCVDRKEVQIKTKFNSYHKEKTVSLDELMESPVFDENILQKNRTVYKKPKAQINKEKAAQIPGMEELWQSIEYYQSILDQNQGKSPFKEGTPKLSQKQIYLYTHFLIQLRTHQYYLIDSYFPPVQSQRNRQDYHPDLTDFQLNYPILPRGLVREKDDYWFKEPRAHRKEEPQFQTKIYSEEEVQALNESKKPYFNFADPAHIYQLVLFYRDLELMVEDQPASPIKLLLLTLDFYIEKARLSDQQKLIIECKKLRMPNKEIADALKEKLGIEHQENYISTIWNKTVKLICQAVELNYDEFLCRNYDKAWKVCNRCGRELFRDQRNFVRKEKALDGLTSRCKDCDRELRKGITRN